MRRALIVPIFVAALALTVAGGCKKGKGEPCYMDSDCKKGLICEGKRCLPYIPCSQVEAKVTQCLDAILTARHPHKVTEQERARYLEHFRRTHLAKCKQERGAYEDDLVKECFSEKDCNKFAKCLLRLEKLK